MAAPRISIIVPVRADAEALAELLAAGPSPDDRIELIVAAADESAGLARLRAGFPAVRWTAAPAGRARQMNHGASLARGDWLVFLHADARLSAGWREEVGRAAAAGAVGGSFRLRIESAAAPARIIERAVALRVRWLDLPYGDQALFVRKDVFDRMGGFRPMELMEDVDFVRRLRRLGRLRHSPLAVRVSARRWERDGWWRRTAGNLAILLLYGAGVSPARLARLYDGGVRS